MKKTYLNPEIDIFNSDEKILSALELQSGTGLDTENDMDE